VAIEGHQERNCNMKCVFVRVLIFQAAAKFLFNTEGFLKVTYLTVYGCRSSTFHTSTYPHHPVYGTHICVLHMLYHLTLDGSRAVKVLCPITLSCGSEKQKPEIKYALYNSIQFVFIYVQT
jgi:hypothetical protein